MYRRRGFSLIEVLIVVTIIGIITTVAIPILTNARRKAMDDKAISSMRVVNSAQQAYFTRTGGYGELDVLAGADPPFLDSRFRSGVGIMGNGLEINLAVTNGGTGYDSMATNPGGNFDYTSDETMVINPDIKPQSED